MYRLELGLACACIASILFDLAVAMQALEAREVPRDHALRPSLLGRLVARPRWLLGTALGAAGWPFHLAGLLLAPLTVVQPALASGLLLLLVLGDRMLGERVGPLEVGAVLAIVLGVAGMAWAAPEHTTSHAGFARLAPALGLLALIAVVPYLTRREGAAASALLPLSAGCAYAWTGISTKLIADFLSSSSWLPVLGWAVATGVLALVGLLSEMSALQSRAATRVAPVVFVVQVSVPVILAPLLTGESWGSTPLGGLALLGFLALVSAGAGVLGSTRAVSGLVAAGVDQVPDGHADQPGGGEAAVQ
jgi:drug/metabolite transporter (DMT)-like permease